MIDRWPNVTTVLIFLLQVIDHFERINSIVFKPYFENLWVNIELNRVAKPLSLGNL